MSNYLKPILTDYFREVTRLEGVLLTINSFIKYTKKNLESIPDQRFVELISTYRDLSQIGSNTNLNFTGQQFSYKISDLRKDALSIASRECCYGIAETYEIFETFLKNILTEILFRNSKYFKPINANKLEVPKSKEEIRDFINQFQKRDRNNKKLLWAFRKLSSFYKQYEKNNILNFNMAEWFDLMSELRHAIIHNRQDFTERAKKAVMRNRNQIIFNRYFNEEQSYSSGKLIIDRLKTGEIIHQFNQFAHLIWKSLSLECDLNTDY